MPPLMISDKHERSSLCKHQVPPVPLDSYPSLISLTSHQKVSTVFSEESKEEQESRRVRFSAIQTTYIHDTPVSSLLSDEEKSEQWWSKEQINKSLESIEKIISSMSSRPKVRDGTLPYHATLYRIEGVCKATTRGRKPDFCDADLQTLFDWHRSTLSKRGLEKLVLNSNEESAKARRSVIRAAEIIKGKDHLTGGLKEETLRSFSEKVTNHHRLFAAVLAKGDELSLSPGPKRRPRRATAA